MIRGVGSPVIKIRGIRAILESSFHLSFKGVFIVECPMFKGCRSYGTTIEEAIENIKEAIAVCVPEYPEHSQSTFIGVRDIEMAIV